MVYLDALFSSQSAIPARTLASMAAGQVRLTGGLTLVCCFCDVDIALNGYLVFASWHFFLDWLQACHEREILCFPAGEIDSQMTTG